MFGYTMSNAKPLNIQSLNVYILILVETIYTLSLDGPIDCSFLK